MAISNKSSLPPSGYDKPFNIPTKGTEPGPPARYGWNVQIVLAFGDASQANY